MARILLAMLATLALMVSPALVTAAQPSAEETSFTSALSGDVIDLGTSGDITFIPESYDFSEGRTVSEEYIWFTTGWSNFEMVLIDGNIEPSEYFELTTGNMLEFYETFEIVDQQVSAESAWFIANAVYQGSPLVVFYDFQLDALGDVDLVVMQFTDAEELAFDMEFVQAEVTVGGNPVLAATDAEAMQSLVMQEERAATPEDATTEAGTTTDRVRPRIAEPGNTTETSDNNTGGLTSDATAESTVESDTSDATAVAGPDWESMGLVSDTEWVSPTFDTAIVWDSATWTFPLDYEFAIYLNDDPVYDVITLETTDGLGYVFISVEDAASTTPISLASRWASPEYAESFEVETTIVETATTRNTASVIYETVNTRDQPLFVVLTATFLEDGTVVYSQISAAPDTIQDVYGQYVDGVQVNGAPIDLTYTVEDLAEISGN